MFRMSLAELAYRLLHFQPIEKCHIFSTHADGGTRSPCLRMLDEAAWPLQHPTDEQMNKQINYPTKEGTNE